MMKFFTKGLAVAALLAVLAENPLRYGADFLEDIDKISIDEIIKQFPNRRAVSPGIFYDERNGIMAGI